MVNLDNKTLLYWIVSGTPFVTSVHILDSMVKHYNLPLVGIDVHHYYIMVSLYTLNDSDQYD